MQLWGRGVAAVLPVDHSSSAPKPKVFKQIVAARALASRKSPKQS